MVEVKSSIELRGLEELAKAAIEAEKELEGSPFWRGHGDADWPLRAHVFRTESLRNNERNLLLSFVLEGSPRTVNAPLQNDRITWIHLAQHYGLPTRLLDWTRSPLTALYFAVCNPNCDSAPGCLWSLNPGMLNRAMVNSAMVLTPEHPGARDLIDEAFTSDQRVPPRFPGKLVAMAAFQHDMRMVVQQSRFTVHGDDCDLRALNIGEANGPLLKQFIIPPDSKAFIRDRLAEIGVTTSMLFPDLSALAATLRLQYER